MPFDFRRLGALLLTLGCSKSAAVVTKSPARALPLHLECRGQGRPPVVLEAGLGNDSTVWSAVMPGVARTTQVCAYDRAGMGQSTRPAPRPHSSTLMAQELRALLRDAQIAEPYVLVGHSLGGANVRYVTAQSSPSVAGLVLVDAATEQQPSRYWALLGEDHIEEFRQGLASLPEDLDYDTFVASLERLSTVSPSLGRRPLVVLTRGKAPPAASGQTAESAAEMEQAWHALQAELPKLSTNSAHVVVEGAGHHIQLDRPEVVVASINEVVAAVREQRLVRAAAISPVSATE